MRTAVGAEREGTLGGASRGNQKLTKTLKTTPVGGAASKKITAHGDVAFERHFTRELAASAQQPLDVVEYVKLELQDQRHRRSHRFQNGKRRSSRWAGASWLSTFSFPNTFAKPASPAPGTKLQFVRSSSASRIRFAWQASSGAIFRLNLPKFLKKSFPIF